MKDLQTIDLDKLTPGPETDALVAEHVMGLCAHVLGPAGHGGPWGRQHQCLKCGAGPFDFHADREGHIVAKDYSTNIAAAWKVVEKMIANGLAPDMDYVPFDGGQWECIFMPPQDPWSNASAPTIQMAICLAALADAKKREAGGIAPSNMGTLPTEPQQPDIGQQFYARDGTLLETVVSESCASCLGCYYLPQKRDGGCPTSIRCGPMTRDDRRGVCFSPVDKTMTVE